MEKKTICAHCEADLTLYDSVVRIYTDMQDSSPVAIYGYYDTFGDFTGNLNGLRVDLGNELDKCATCDTDII